jgi:hypothetical protein
MRFIPVAAIFIAYSVAAFDVWSIVSVCDIHGQGASERVVDTRPTLKDLEHGPSPVRAVFLVAASWVVDKGSWGKALIAWAIRGEQGSMEL